MFYAVKLIRVCEWVDAYEADSEQEAEAAAKREALADKGEILYEHAVVEMLTIKTARELGWVR